MRSSRRSSEVNSWGETASRAEVVDLVDDIDEDSIQEIDDDELREFKILNYLMGKLLLDSTI